MRKILKWIGIVLAAVLGVLIVVVGGVVIYANVKFKPAYPDRDVYPISADTSPEGVARGKYLMEDAMLCTEACHSEFGKTLAGGSDQINQGPVSVVWAVPNITPDNDTGIGRWSDGEIARAIREGIDNEGIGLAVMPSYNYRALSDADMAALIGYLRSVEPVSNEVPPFDGNIVAKVMLALGMFGLNPVGEPITAEQLTPQQGTVENGKYMLSVGDCSACHKENLAGGALPLSSPEDAPAANLTPGGSLAFWTADDFIAAVRDGVHPGGGALDGRMPRYGTTDADLRDIFEYLMTLPALPMNE